MIPLAASSLGGFWWLWLPGCFLQLLWLLQLLGCLAAWLSGCLAAWLTDKEENTATEHVP